jgi:hypothetical protein
MALPPPTAREQELAQRICRYAIETEAMPTLAEMARQMGISRSRVAQIWWRIERRERLRRVDPAVHIKRRDAGYLLAVLKDIEKAAKMAGRAYPWRRQWQGPRKPEPVKPKRRPYYAERTWLDRSWTEDPPAAVPPRWTHKPQFAGLVECRTCSGCGYIDGEPCPRCGGEATVKGGI